MSEQKTRWPIVKSPSYAAIFYMLAEQEDNSVGLAKRGIGKTQGIVWTQMQLLYELGYLKESKAKKNAYALNADKITEEFISYLEGRIKEEIEWDTKQNPGKKGLFASIKPNTPFLKKDLPTNDTYLSILNFFLKEYARLKLFELPLSDMFNGILKAIPSLDDDLLVCVGEEKRKEIDEKTSGAFLTVGYMVSIVDQMLGHKGVLKKKNQEGISILMTIGDGLARDSTAENIMLKASKALLEKKEIA